MIKHGKCTDPYEKFTRVTLVKPLSGSQYSEKVSEGCKAAWKAAGICGEAEAQALEKFKAVFKDQNFPPGSSIQFTNSPIGLVVCFIYLWLLCLFLSSHYHIGKYSSSCF